MLQGFAGSSGGVATHLNVDRVSMHTCHVCMYEMMIHMIHIKRVSMHTCHVCLNEKMLSSGIAHSGFQV